MTTRSATLAVVTPTLGRPDEVLELLATLRGQDRRPEELIVVDGAEPSDRRTEDAVAAVAADQPFRVRYQRGERGTAVQRNAGLDLVSTDLVAFIDDDVRLEPDFLSTMAAVFAAEGNERVGGVVGYRVTSHARVAESTRWRWYRRLHLFGTYEPGRYDWTSGYPINANLQPPFTGTRPVDFLSTSCAVWRAEVFADGLRFDPFFRDYGVLEDAHLSLRAGKTWTLLQCGDARCRELSAPGGRVSTRNVGRKSVVNYWYTFTSVAGPLTPGQRFRFWRFQTFELLRVGAGLARHPSRATWENLRGRVDGMVSIARGRVT